MSAPAQQQQTRTATTYAPPSAAPSAHPSAPTTTAQAPTPTAGSQGPGLLGQMASTAAYVSGPSPSADDAMILFFENKK